MTTFGQSHAGKQTRDTSAADMVCNATALAPSAAMWALLTSSNSAGLRNWIGAVVYYLFCTLDIATQTSQRAAGFCDDTR